jgi:hypothetical protein
MPNDLIITKRHLGLALSAAGVLAFLSVLILDGLRGEANFGPTQQLALVGCVGLALLGLTLLPGGDRPA